MTTAAGFVNVPLSAALLGDQPDARREQLRMMNRAVTCTTSRHRAPRSRRRALQLQNAVHRRHGQSQD
jgi:hypothetical protein